MIRLHICVFASRDAPGGPQPECGEWGKVVSIPAHGFAAPIRFLLSGRYPLGSKNLCWSLTRDPSVTLGTSASEGSCRGARLHLRHRRVLRDADEASKGAVQNDVPLPQQSVGLTDALLFRPPLTPIWAKKRSNSDPGDATSPPEVAQRQADSDGAVLARFLLLWAQLVSKARKSIEGSMVGGQSFVTASRLAMVHDALCAMMIQKDLRSRFTM